jgi:hypothetical protein
VFFLSLPPPPNEIEFCKGFGSSGDRIEKLRAGFRILNLVKIWIRIKDFGLM